MMVGSPMINGRIFSLLKARIGKKRTIIVGLKSDNYSREMLRRLLSSSVVVPGDSVLAVHVQESNDGFDPNTFLIHEDLCKYKQVGIFFNTDSFLLTMATSFDLSLSLPNDL